MATLNALKQLGKSIKSDIAGAVSNVADRIEHARSERKVVADFKALLREDPVLVTRALTEAVKPKRARRTAEA